MIRHIEIVEYGVKLPKPRIWNAMWFIVLLSILYYHELILPTPIVERYLSMSQQIDKYPIGYVGGFLTMATPTFYIQLPMLLTVVAHSTRYLKYYLPLAAICLVFNGFIAREVLVRDINQLEVWNRVKIHYGEAFTYAIGYALWAHLGFKQGLGAAFGSRVFLLTKAGFGFISKGIPIGIILLAYTAYEAYRTTNKSIDGAPPETILFSITIGILYGLLMRRFPK